MARIKKAIFYFLTVCLLAVMTISLYNIKNNVQVVLKGHRKILQQLNENTKFTDQENAMERLSRNEKQLFQPKYHENIMKSAQSNIQEKCERRFPKAILVGSQKSGTGALLNFLDYHPHIASCLHPPEPRYFSLYYNKNSFEWYRNKMPCSTRDQVTIEKTPEYIYGDKPALRIKEFNNQMKILMILKDPVVVSLSIYTMWKTYNRSEVIGKTFEDMVTVLDNNQRKIINPDSRIIYLATYALHVPIWYRLFDRDQILVLDGTAFEIEPMKELNKVEKFLGISNFYNERHFVFNETKKKFCFLIDESTEKCLPPNKGRTHPPISEELRKLLGDYFSSFNKKLVEIVGHSFMWM